MFKSKFVGHVYRLSFFLVHSVPKSEMAGVGGKPGCGCVVKTWFVMGKRFKTTRITCAMHKKK